MMDLQVWKQRREELMREAHQARLAKALRDSRKGRRVGLAAVALLLLGTLGISTAFVKESSHIRRSNDTTHPGYRRHR
jgi:hypothetical protein